MRPVVSVIPNWARAPLRRVRNAARSVPYYGHGRFCPVCENSSSRFRRFGSVPRADGECAHCGAVERHRLFWLFVSTRTDLFDGRTKKVLHVAPETCLESNLLRRLGNRYLTADLFNTRAMVKMDISDIDYPDQSFDVIYCSHVLEHVPDDREAMRELYRVLKSDGWAILLVPITAVATFEDASIVTAEDRLRVYGQSDHVRRYGPDYVDRLRDAGFKVEVVRPGDLVSSEEVVRMGLTAAAGEIYYCKR